MYHLDKMLGPHSDDVGALRKGNVVKRAHALVKPGLAELEKRARIAKAQHDGNRGIGAPGLDRVEFGTMQSDHLGQQIVVSHDRGADLVDLHGVKTPLIDIRRDLRMAITSVSAGFSAAQTDAEQTGQKRALAAVIDAVLREDADLAAKVRENIARQRYD